MSWREVLSEAWYALASHRLRAGLSGTGIVFGVATVVAAMAIAEGARRRAYEETAALGVDSAFVRARPPAAGHPPAPRFTPGDLEALARDMRDGTIAAARHSRGTVERGSRSLTTAVAGVTPSWRAVAGLALGRGRWLSSDDVTQRRRVVVLAPALAASLGGAEPGAEVRWEDRWFTVIGILQPLRRAEGQPSAYIPITAADHRLGADDDGRGAQEVALRMPPGGIEAAARDAARVLRGRGHAEGTLDLIVPLALMRARIEAQRTFDWVLFGVGALALAISGIGIMNIMLASVAERTSEIGVRRAAGARRRDVLAQFAAEAGLLCVAGGAAGIPLGALFAALIAAGAGWPVAVAPSSIAVALLLAVAVGMIFGTYPAHRASMLDPVEALRA